MGKWDTLRSIDGLFVGMLDAEELAIFNEACKRYEAQRSYEGAGGALGLAKVRVTALSPSENAKNNEQERQ